MALVGIISDTHGLLRPQALRALHGVDHILHAGDVGDPGILRELEKLAPTTAVRGNTDRGSWASDLPWTQVVEIEEIVIYLIHDLAELDLDPGGAGFHLVVSGHTHEPAIRRARGVLYVNPGSAGPVRGMKPVSLGMADVVGDTVDAHILPLL